MENYITAVITKKGNRATKQILWAEHFVFSINGPLFSDKGVTYFHRTPVDRTKCRSLYTASGCYPLWCSQGHTSPHRLH